MKKVLIALSFVALLQASDRKDRSLYKYNECFENDDGVEMMEVLKGRPDLLTGALLCSAIFKNKNRIARMLLSHPEIYQKCDDNNFIDALGLAVQHNDALTQEVLSKGACVWAHQMLHVEQCTQDGIKDDAATRKEFDRLFWQRAYVLANAALFKAQSAATVSTLITYGANARLTDENGLTALHHAVHRDAHDVVKALIPHCDINEPVQPFGSTPLAYAQTESMRRLLLEAGAEE